MNDELARSLVLVADVLDRAGFQATGVLRQAARVLTNGVQPDERGCHGCGAELVQPATGRRRKWCTEACRSRHRRR